MTRIPRRAAIAALAAAGLLLGCSSDPDPATTPPSTPASASATASASPNPTSTLSAAKQQAVDEATAVVLAYEQMQVDLLANPEPNLNDLNTVTAQPQLRTDQINLQETILAGDTVIESTGPITIASVEPVKIDLKGDPPTVTLLVCVDSSAVSGTYEGRPSSGRRQSVQHRVVKTDYLPAPGWAVAEVLPPAGFDQPQPC